MRLLAAVLTLVLAAPAGAAPAPPREARWAAGWLAARVGKGGYVTGLDGKPDLATSVVIGLALAAAGVAPKTVDAVATYAAGHIDDVAVANGADRPGALGRLAMLAAASGRDPNAFGGTAQRHRLVDRILATRATLGPDVGRFKDPVYDGTFSHSLGLLGVAAARSLTETQRAGVTSALDYLVAQQCANGAWQHASRLVVAGLALTECSTGANGPDTNTAALATQALAAHKRAPARDAVAWFGSARNAAGGWGYSPGAATDADSTALVVQALLASRADAQSGIAVLKTLQIRCAGPAKERGAFAYMAGKPLRPNVYATAEAVPAVAGKPFPLTRPAATVARASVPC